MDNVWHTCASWDESLLKTEISSFKHIFTEIQSGYITKHEDDQNFRWHSPISMQKIVVALQPIFKDLKYKSVVTGTTQKLGVRKELLRMGKKNKGMFKVIAFKK